MKFFQKYFIQISILVFICSCSNNRHVPKANSNPRKHKSCNCPTFGYDSHSFATKGLFYI
jgi:hypothetical protein